MLEMATTQHTSMTDRQTDINRNGYDTALYTLRSPSSTSSELIIKEARCPGFFVVYVGRRRNRAGRRFKMHRRSLSAEQEAVLLRTWTDDARSINASTFYGRFGNASRLSPVPLGDRKLHRETKW